MCVTPEWRDLGKQTGFLLSALPEAGVCQPGATFVFTGNHCCGLEAAEESYNIILI